MKLDELLGSHPDWDQLRAMQSVLEWVDGDFKRLEATPGIASDHPRLCELADIIDEIFGKFVELRRKIERERFRPLSSLRQMFKDALNSIEATYSKLAVEKLRRKIAISNEQLADRCRSAIHRSLAWLMIDALLDQVAKLAALALNQLQPNPPPGVISAGGDLGLFVPLN